MDVTPDPVEVAVRAVVPVATKAFLDSWSESGFGRRPLDDGGHVITPFRAIAAALDAVGYAALVAERDRLRHALTNGWSLGQYNWNEEFNRRAALSDEGEVT